MSWQDFVDKQLMDSQCLTKACISGLDGNIWAQSDGLKATKEELSSLISGLDQPDQFVSNGITLDGKRYIYLSGTDQVVRAKQGTSGVHCMKTTQALIVALYEGPILHQQAAAVVEKLGDYLISCGY